MPEPPAPTPAGDPFKPAIPESDLQRRLQAAAGYLALGMPADAAAELDALPSAQRTEDAVLALRIEVYCGLGQWQSARQLAESLAQQSPDNPAWWIQWAYALRREQSVAAARMVLLEAANRHGKVALIIYNLACYACVLGEIDEAKRLLLRAFRMDQDLKQVAIDDPDLKPLFGGLRKPPP